MTTEPEFKIALLQMQCGQDPEANTGKAVNLIKEAAGSGASLICLPELYRTPYFCQTEDSACFDLAETIPGPSTEAFCDLCGELGVSLIAPLFEKRASGVYHNTVAVINDRGEVEGIYRKMHIPDDPGFYEKFYFTPGDLGFKSFIISGFPVGTLICWDQWYPEAARLTAMMGASLIVYPTAIGWITEDKDPAVRDAQFDSWRTVQRGHAISNGCFVAAVNRVGFEETPGSTDGIRFWGSSFACDPQGVVLAEASKDKEEILLVDIDPLRVEAFRRQWPFFRDRRIDAYNDIAKRFLND